MIAAHPTAKWFDPARMEPMERRLMMAETVAWSRYLGGSAEDAAYDVACDGSGNVFVLGTTASASLAGSANASRYRTFLAKLNSAGSVSRVVFLGGASPNVTPTRLAVDTSGNVYACGSLRGKFAGGSTAYGGLLDGFVVKYTNSLSRVWARNYGGGGDDVINGVAADTLGNVWAVGSTTSPRFTGVAGRYHGSDEGFVLKLSASSGAARAGGKYLGGSSVDSARAVAVTADKYCLRGRQHDLGRFCGNDQGTPRRVRRCLRHEAEEFRHNHVHAVITARRRSTASTRSRRTREAIFTSAGTPPTRRCPRR